MIEIGSIVWGVKDLDRAINFWTRALNYKIKGEKRSDWVILVPKQGSGMQLSLNVVSSLAPPPPSYRFILWGQSG